jgi:hypothetical protein
MRAVAWVVIGFAGCFAGDEPAWAGGDAPAIVIPGRAGVPVIIDGRDATHCVVEGDWGLARPGQVPPTIVACPLLAPLPGQEGRYYYPAFGRRPGYGRVEVEPPAERRLPPPAEGYYREWGARSDRIPASVDPPADVQISVEPQVDGRRRRFRPHNEQPKDRNKDRN